MTFTVTLDAAVAGGLTATPDFDDDTATSGTDYTENTTPLRFTGTAGETKSFTVATLQDTDVETDETFTVRLAVSGVSVPVVTASATGTITDDDDDPQDTRRVATPEVTVADASADEGDSMTFEVTLDKAVSGGLTVTPRFTDGTATKGVDYTENTAALRFTGTAGETRSFTVATTEDTDVETDETFTVTLAVSGTSKTVTATDSATGTITDDDDDPQDTGRVATPEVTVADASADEGDSMTFTVTLDKAVSGGLTVTPSFTDGTATKGVDYTENTRGLGFAGNAGETRTFTVATTEDSDVETDETFTVSLAVSGTSATVTATDTATGTITNDDRRETSRVAAAVTVADASASEGDPLTFTVTLSEAVQGGLTVTPGFADGTATSGADYTENTAALRFAGTAGETMSFTVATTEDSDVETDETFTVSLVVSGTAATVTATDTATGTITNDDRETSRVAAAVTVADTWADEGDSMTFTVTLDNAVKRGLTVTPSFTDGTATEGDDYTENTAPLRFAGTAGETRSFTVATTEDSDVETDETFTVSLAVSGTSATVTATDTATGTITNDDRETSRVAAAEVTVADTWADEGESMTFEVTLDKAVSGGLTVTPRFTDGTATKGADYTENTSALRFTGTAGETMSFTVATTEDTDVETDETFTVSLVVSGTSATVTATDTATGTITNDDRETSRVAAAVTVADAAASEGDPIGFTVTLDNAVPGGLTVTPSFTDGTATEGDDYTENTSTLTFDGRAGETRTFTVTTIEDQAAEAEETFTVGLSVSGTSATVTATDTATGTITDDDDATVTVADASAAEGDVLTFTVTLDKAVAGGLTVTPRFTDGTATKGTDYTENTAKITFAGTDRRDEDLHGGDDRRCRAVEPDETFTVNLTVSGTSATVTATDTATGTIVDDDDAPAVDPVREPGERERGGRVDGGHGDGGVLDGPDVHRGPDGDGLRRGRHGDLGHGLHGGVRLRRHHRLGGRAAGRGPSRWRRSPTAWSRTTRPSRSSAMRGRPDGERGGVDADRLDAEAGCERGPRRRGRDHGVHGDPAVGQPAGGDRAVRDRRRDGHGRRRLHVDFRATGVLGGRRPSNGSAYRSPTTQRSKTTRRCRSRCSWPMRRGRRCRRRAPSWRTTFSRSRSLRPTCRRPRGRRRSRVCSRPRVRTG